MNWLRLRDGQFAELLPAPAPLASLYACLPHLRLARLYSPDRPGGALADVDIEHGCEPLDVFTFDAARARGWAP